MKVSKRRARDLMAKYGLTVHQYLTMVRSNGSRCHICGKKFTKTLRPNVDHDHETGTVRGALCWYCNKYRVAKNDIGHIRAVFLYVSRPMDWRRYEQERRT